MLDTWKEALDEYMYFVQLRDARERQREEEEEDPPLSPSLSLSLSLPLSPEQEAMSYFRSYGFFALLPISRLTLLNFLVDECLACEF